MKSRLIVTASLLLAASLLGGCAQQETKPKIASAGGPPSPSAAAADNATQMRKYAQCMRANGVDMPDPKGNEAMSLPAMTVDSPESKKIEAALEKCRSLMPISDLEPPKLSPADIEKARAMSKCLRENGVPNYPDPDPETGAVKLTESGIDGDKMSAAAKKCQGVGPAQGAIIQKAG